MVALPKPVPINPMETRCLNPPMSIYLEAFDGSTARVPARCGQCRPCLLAWQKRWRSIISNGSSYLYADQGGWQFVTLTIPDRHVPKVVCTATHPRDQLSHRNPVCSRCHFCCNCVPHLTQRLMASWREFRKHLSKYGGLRYYVRVLEWGSLNGRPHLHLAVQGDVFPVCEKLSGFNTLKQWVRSLTPRGKAFYARLVDFGLGVYHSERVRNGVGGITVYLSKYLTKAGKHRVRLLPNMSRVRTAETSRGWPRSTSLKLAHVVKAIRDPKRSSSEAWSQEYLQAFVQHPAELRHVQRQAFGLSLIHI